VGSKTLFPQNENPSVLNWSCQQTQVQASKHRLGQQTQVQVDLYNGHKTIVVSVVLLL